MSLTNKSWKHPASITTREIGCGNLPHHVKAYLKCFHKNSYWMLHEVNEVWCVTASPAIMNQVHAFVQGFHAVNSMITAEPIDA